MEISADATVEERNRRVAVKHANSLQYRKDIDMEILSAIETLMYFPLDSRASALRPVAADVASLNKLAYLFTPSDFDELIHERNCMDKCGYVLCPNSFTRSRNSGPIRVLRRGNDYEIVPTATLDKWCSKDCAKRTIFIKVQLNTQPVWERDNHAQFHVDIFGNEHDEVLSKVMSGISISDQKIANGSDMHQTMRQLALERNETTSSNRVNEVMLPNLVEKLHINPPQAPHEGSASEIEGFVPRLAKEDAALFDEDKEHDIDDWLD